VAKVLPVGLRDRGEIQRARDAAAAGTDPHGDYVTDFTTGAVSAFDWLLGLSAAPLSGMDAEVTVRDIVHEEDLAGPPPTYHSNAVQAATRTFPTLLAQVCRQTMANLAA
jgi:hypothetical protein